MDELERGRLGLVEASEAPSERVWLFTYDCDRLREGVSGLETAGDR